MIEGIRVAQADFVEDLKLIEIQSPERIRILAEKLKSDGVALLVQEFFGEFGAKCLLCGLWLFHPAAAKLHVLGHITGKNLLRNLANPLDGDVVECIICGGRFASFEEFEQHFGLFHDLRPEDLKKGLKDVVKFKIASDVPRCHSFSLDGRVVKLEPGLIIEIPREIARILAYYEYGGVIE